MKNPTYIVSLDYRDIKFNNYYEALQMAELATHATNIELIQIQIKESPKANSDVLEDQDAIC